MAEDPIRPSSAAACLDYIAHMLEYSGKALNLLAKERGLEPASSGTQMEADVRAWAEFLRSEPELDAKLMAVLRDGRASVER